MPHVTHIPPPKKSVEKLARQTSKEFAKTHDSAYRLPEVTEGLVEFLQIVADMKAQQLNHQQTIRELTDGR